MNNQPSASERFSLARMINTLRRQYALTLVAFGALSFLAFAAFILVSEAVAGDAHYLDRAVLMWLRFPDGDAIPRGGLLFQRMMIETAGFGDNAVLAILAIGAACYLSLSGKYLLAGVALGVTFSGAALTALLKAIFAQNKPEYVTQIVELSSAHFPSGHASMTVLVYMTFAWMIAEVQKSQALKAFFIGFAMFISLLVGFTRVYVGVHYPTDVFAGWAAGAAWALIWMALVSHLRHKMPSVTA